MIDQRNRQCMKEALVKPYGDPRPDIERLAMAAIENRPAHRTATRAIALAAVVLVIALALSIALAGRLLRPASQIVGSHEQNAAMLEQLRQRPLSLPGLGSDGSCPITPQVTARVSYKNGQVFDTGLYGVHGPIYGQGGPEVTGKHGYYYFVTWMSDAKYDGLALVRGRKLNGPDPIVFAGHLAGGRLMWTDSVPASVTAYANSQTTPTKFYDELILPAGSSGGFWRQWNVTQGVSGPGCYAFQVDGPSFQDIVIVEVAKGG